jgi:predicted ester cyclase
MKRILRGKNKQKGKKQDDENPPISDMPPPSSMPNGDPRYSQRNLNQDPRYSGEIPEEQYTGVPRGNIDFRYSDELDPRYVVEDSVRLRQQQLDQMNIQQRQMQKHQQDPRYVQEPHKRSQRPLDPRERDEREYEEPQYDRRPPSYNHPPNEGPPPQKRSSAKEKFHAASAKHQQQMEHNVAPPPAKQRQQQPQPQPPRMANSPQQQQPRAASPQQQQQRVARHPPSPQAKQQHAPPQRAHQERQVFEPSPSPLLKEEAPPKPAVTVNGIDPVVQMERAAVCRELVKQYVADIWNRGDLELIPKVCARGLRFNGSAGMDRVGHDGFSRMVQTIRGSLEDYHCEIHSMVVEGNKAFCRMRFTGRHVGQLLGYEATGKHVSWMGASEFTVVDGLIVKVWELGDMASLEHQLREATDHPGEA